MRLFRFQLVRCAMTSQLGSIMACTVATVVVVFLSAQFVDQFRGCVAITISVSWTEQVAPTAERVDSRNV